MNPKVRDFILSTKEYDSNKLNEDNSASPKKFIKDET